MTELVTVRVSELSGAALDWAVAVAEFGKVYVYPDGGLCPPAGTISMNDDDGSLWTNTGEFHHGDAWAPSTSWSQGGPLMDKHCKGFGMVQDRTHTRWRSFAYQEATGFQRMLGGETILIAFCRALVALTLGETVQIPAQIETDHV